MVGWIIPVGNSATPNGQAARPALRPLAHSLSMPELPEVEVVRRGLADRAVGHPVRAVVSRVPALRWPLPPALPVLLVGQTLRGLKRRGKYLCFGFDHGTLIVHLGMSGTLAWLPPDTPPQRHDHFDLCLDAGLIRLNDPRRFGAVLWQDAAAGPPEAHPLLASLGIEPFDPQFDGAWIHAGTRGRRSPIKQVLLAGAVVVGVGNIYASESLFRAGIRPSTPAGRLSRARCQKLADAVRQTLAAAIEAGGSTLRDFVSTEGDAGHFLNQGAVYGRAGAPCKVCGTAIRRAVFQQRATYWCPRCQT